MTPATVVRTIVILPTMIPMVGERMKATGQAPFFPIVKAEKLNEPMDHRE
jgi:hypothetical protein